MCRECMSGITCIHTILPLTIFNVWRYDKAMENALEIPHGVLLTHIEFFFRFVGTNLLTFMCTGRNELVRRVSNLFLLRKLVFLFK